MICTKGVRLMFPADMQVADWLQWFVEDSDTSEARLWFHLPDGRRCATDGKMAVITGDPSPNDAAPGVLTGRHQTVPTKVMEILAQPPQKSITLPWSEAVALFGPCEHMTTTTCPQCKGKKKMPHRCGCGLCEADEEDCDFCDGTGIAEEYPEIKTVRVWGTLFDPNRAAYILAHAPACDEVTLALCKNAVSSGEVLRFTTARWEAVLVPLLSIDKMKEYPEVMKYYTTRLDAKARGQAEGRR